MADQVAPTEKPLEASSEAGKQQEASSEAGKHTEASSNVEKQAEPSADAEEHKEEEQPVPSTAAESEMKEQPDVAPNKDTSRRKSGGAEQKKTLNKKGSKARLLHTNAQPGDHFLVKLKGFPAWPAVVCDEEMLPEALLKSRPVTAAKPDGTYAPNYAEGGKRIYDRTFPVMYLHTNEFGWVVNTALTELPPDKARDSITEKMRKDLRSAFELAAKHNSVEHYKEELKNFMEAEAAEEEARRLAAATPKKSKKKGGDEDVDMDNADDAPKSSKSKKRKADEDSATPARSDSVKKPKIKLNTSSTPKAANGTPKADSAVKSAKSKAKKSDTKKEPKEAKMTPEERHQRKEKEVLYLRHKLQRGLLTRDQQPQENEMKQMSEFVGILENFAELEVSIIRTTKINKVLKAILKLESIPREEEFNFKKRSQALLDKWNKLMAGDGGAAPANGVNGAGDTKRDSEPNGVAADDEKNDSDKTTEEKTAAQAQDKSASPVADAVEEKPAETAAA